MVTDSFCCCSVDKSCLTLQTRGPQYARVPCPSLFPRVCSNYVPWIGDTIQRPYLLSSTYPLAFNLYSIRVFFSELIICIRLPKYWSFSFSISSFNEYSGLTSFRIDWFDLLAVQGTLKNLLHHHNLKVLVLQCSALFMVQLSHPYMTTRKTIALTIWTFVSKVMSLLFNTLSRFVIAFLPRIKWLLIDSLLLNKYFTICIFILK